MQHAPILSPPSSLPSSQADAVLSRRVFVGVARGLWDRHGRDLIAAADGKRVLSSWFQTAAASLALEVSSRCSGWVGAYF